MHSSIATSKGENATRHSNKPRQPLSGKSTTVDKLEKHLVRGLVVGHIGHRNENGKEAQQMNHQDDRLKPGEQLASYHVDSQRQQDCRPHEKGSMPGLRLVQFVTETDSALDLSPCKKRGRGKRSLPSNDGNPSYDDEVSSVNGDSIACLPVM